MAHGVKLECSILGSYCLKSLLCIIGQSDLGSGKRRLAIGHETRHGYISLNEIDILCQSGRHVNRFCLSISIEALGSGRQHILLVALEYAHCICTVLGGNRGVIDLTAGELHSGVGNRSFATHHLTGYRDRIGSDTEYCNRSLAVGERIR